MRSIVLLNAKGGCGKTTLTTNLASCYAAQGKSVLLADFDPQGSSIDWLAAGPELTHLARHAEAAIVPVLPSPIDIRAAAHFISELVLTCRALRHEGRLAVVANRVREQTLIYQDLERFLKSLDIPFIATLRETQNYIRAVQQGIGIFELPTAQAAPDVEQWQPLLGWLEQRDEVRLLEREARA